jgi:hypothetical protein
LPCGHLSARAGRHRGRPPRRRTPASGWQPALHTVPRPPFEGVVDEEIAGLEELLAATHRLDLETFVVAHTLDPVSQDIELIFGRARLNNRGGEAWHWYQDLVTAPPADGGRRRGDSPLPTGPDAVPDAPVRLRRMKHDQPGDRASGEA